MRGVAITALAVASLGVAGCSHIMHPLGGDKAGPKQMNNPDSAVQIGVNGYLWRATLDTLAFMPLASADPYGGVIITDWYAFPEKPNERFKITVYILDARLRADGLNLVVYRQTKDAAGAWIDAPATSQTETDLENAILDKARRLRLSNLKG
ncbi:DUF3576 domain-containing protein [Phenylobacterium sp.]|uniref:DUF3576 domain-containing protein n=1 Tax=Phenylobacterium sp. TaxID=1871053 RepID=UPI001214CCE7|nr:DUF3576 domain-containing protein [Phenylobacterium sp.]THD57840.1 MAG: DUF3576 domain-containing protein [Phenylobacterium sp.]